MLTSEPAKPPEVQVVPAIMVRPQDKWSGSGVVVAPAKPKKTKGMFKYCDFYLWSINTDLKSMFKCLNIFVVISQVISISDLLKEDK